MSTDLGITLSGKDPAELAVKHQVRVDPLTGRALISVPLELTLGRGGFGPQLSLRYDSTGTPSPFGTGWALDGQLAVSVGTRGRLPSYDSSEVYSFSLSGELVPTSETFGVDGYTVKRWRARREDSHIRVEQWTNDETGRVHWRTRDTSNTLSIYGLNPDDSTRIFDPEEPGRVFSWLVERQFDTAGNAVFYEYDKEDRSTLDEWDRNEPFERGRGGATAQRYLRNVYYGNSEPLGPDEAVPEGNTWRLRVELEYTARPDAYSTYTAGFEVRTYRLCERIAQYHEFAALGGEELVAAYDLDHVLDESGSRLTAVNYTGFSGEDDRSVPPLSFTYTEPEVEGYFGDAPVEAARNTPGGITGRNHWMDLYGDGLPGILTETPQAWLYKSNEGNGRFGQQTLVGARPAYALDQVALADFDADGNPNLAVLHGRSGGFYAFDRDTETWRGFRSFEELPHLESAQGRAQWLDVNGDGRAELVFADAERFTWYPSLGERGFGDPVTHELPAAADAPFAEVGQVDFRFADMCGHGMADQVRVRNGRVEYWPQHGRGRFGEPVLMAGAPVFAPDHEFDVNRVLLVDLDGTGTADIVYLGANEVRWWYNASGNRLLPGGRIPVSVDNLSTVRVLDFLGDGTPCLVWSSPYPDSADDIRFLRLTSGIKPHLITELDTGTGARHSLTYTTSAEHYLRDRRANRKWSTKLPSHTTVVNSHETRDLVGGARALSRFEYHDGRFDHEERLLMFGAVDRWDTDGDAGPDTVGSCVRQWFHPGTNRPRLIDAWNGDPDEAPLPFHVVDDAAALLPGEYEHAVVGLAGRPLREECFPVTPLGEREAVPLAVTRLSYGARKLAEGVTGHDVSVGAYRAQRLAAVYEGVADDPRLTHEMTLDVTAEGIASLRCNVSYPRRGTADTPQQTKLRMAAFRLNALTVDEPQRWEPGIDVASDEYELTGFLPGESGIFDYLALRQEIADAVDTAIAFDATPSPFPTARLIGARRAYFWNNSGTAALPHGQVGAVTRPHHSEEACLTTGFANTVGDGEITAGMLTQAGYTLREGYWWRSGETLHYGERFNLVERAVRPDGGRTVYGYDAAEFAPVSVTDPLDNVVTASLDYRRLAVNRTVDPNGTVTESILDPLGVASVATVHGDVDGVDYGQDPLADYNPQPAPTVAEVLDDPDAYVQNAASFMHYELGAPSVVVRLVREQLSHGGAPTPDRTGVIISYVDGFGRPLQTKKLVDPGDAVRRDEGGDLILGPDGNPVLGPVPQRWLADGHVSYNLKQESVRLYEPFYTGTPAYESDTELATFGAEHRYRHDALGRLTRHDFPNQTFERIERGPWSVTDYDGNDTVQDSGYRLLRESLPATEPERRAYDQTVPHADTPTISYLDTDGGVVATSQVTTAGQPPSVTTVDRDVHGSEITTTDARGIAALRHYRDMMDRSWRTDSVDAGIEFCVIDVYDRETHSWTPNGEHIRHQYDSLDRPTAVEVGGRRVQEFTYGEAVPDGADRNARGLLVRQRDQAGTEEFDSYSPFGEVLRVSRRLASDYTTEPDWSGPVALDPETHTSAYDYDAVSRVARARLADDSVRTMTYAAGGGLTRVRVSTTDGKVTDLDVLDGVEYNARGERVAAALGNGVDLSYVYDPETFRTALRTATRGTTVLSDVEYTYDPVGNVIRARDNAQQPGGGPITGLTVSPESTYTYDAAYRLINATGRVHQALLEHDYIPGGAGTVKGTRHLSLNNGAAVERYSRTYEYDAVGNRRYMRHNGTSRTWVSDMWISSISNRSLPALEPSGVTVPDPEDRFDDAGNVIRLAHLRRMEWSYRGTLSRAVVIERDDDPDDAEYYCYDGAGQRVRKVFTRLVSGQVETTEKIYLDGCEIKRIRSNGSTLLERLTSLVTDENRRVALIHRWNTDTTGRETDDVDDVRVRYPLGNHLDSAELELDEAGAVVSYEEYFPFGGTAFVAGDSLREVRMRDYRFSGKENDDATGLYYFGHRYYAAWTGRWISADPMGPVDGTNLYVYVRNNPVTFADPNGLQTTTTETQQGEHHVVEMPELPEALRGVRLTPAQVRLWNQGELAIVRLPGSDAPTVMSRREYLALLRRVLRQGGNATTVRVTPRRRRGGNSTPSHSADAAATDASIDESSSTAEGGGAETGDGGGAGSTTSTGPGGGEASADGTGTESGTGSGESTTGPDGNGAGSTGTGTDAGTGTNSGDGSTTPETGTGGGEGTGTGTGGGGTGTTGTGPGSGATGTGTGGGGTGTAPGGGTGAAGAGPGGGATGTGSGSGSRPGGGTGTNPGTGGGSGGSPTGSAQGAPGGSPDGFEGGEAGGVAGGAVGGRVGGDLEHGVLGGGGTGAGSQSDDGTDSRHLGGSTPGGGDTGGSAPGSGSGGSDSRPGQTGTGSGGNPRPDGGSGRGGRGGHGGAGSGQSGGQSGGSPNGAPGGNPNGNPNGTPSGAGGGSGSTGNGGGSPTTMDRVAQIAGYTNLEFGGDEGGRSGGIPGGMGWLHGSGWQMLYTALSVFSLVTLFASVGIRSFFRGVLELGRRLAPLFTRVFWRRLATSASRMLTRRFWRRAWRNFTRSSFARFFWDSRNYDSIRRAYWNARGGANGMQLHHWFFEQNGGFVGRFIPNGLKNAGWNLFAVPAFTNNYVSRQFTIGSARWFLSRGWGTAIRIAIPGSLISGGYWGARLGEWLSDDSPAPPPASQSTPESSSR
ncbi:SpvB/TcaC N-terminal domain-containing protein [Stackebrandtia nassauensis]|uniref:Rhs family protein-like protein n=1 Tax=Stackebrandtia nassauensis (strain DSM 44728 / CIP 108903 / NRRL B-16338 / NBRC 102104 / LLR-40K-21) TaxID=446470 RepID=D3Q1Y1_STANL|nr:SpvB/TcaC N-terminal domain-containing protein [Stackebrandtia nassauensis]ADD41848.1 Rhs family protein-like protein [Stackebrandtia nassauensis DSM 44728]